MMASSTVGGYLGGRYAKRVNEKFLRQTVILFGVVLAAAYFQRGFVA